MKAKDISLITLVRLLEKVKATATDGGRFAVAMGAHEEDLEKLGEAQTALTSTVWGGDAKELVQKFRQANWENVVVRLGMDGSLDFNLRKFKYAPLEEDEPDMPAEREKLPKGELLVGRVGPSVLLKRRRLEGTFGVNFGGGQVVGDTSTIGGFVQPNASLSYVVAFLDRREVEGDKYLRRVPKLTDKGDLPPRWVLGARVVVEVPFDPPEFQTSDINGATILIHSDFIVSEKLKFRIGVPIEGTLIVQEPDTGPNPDIEKETGLQWSIPVFGATVLAF